MQQMQPNPVLIEWGWRTAAGFIVTGFLGLFVLAIKWSVPVLGEKAYRMFGERAFKAEWQTLTRTAEIVNRIEPIVTHTAEHVRTMEEHMNEGFAALHESIQTMSNQMFELARGNNA